ncbi:MAG: thioredoxin domain-containing protein [Phycisphaeraceae bacterium]|nr:thioredoxin domain-containing protein [Phycisphaeraceae bacterium]
MSARPPAQAMLWLIRLLAGAALVLSIVLLIQSLRGSGLPGCGQASSCDQVLNSPWSTIVIVPGALMIPSALPAVALYALMVAASFAVKRRGAWLLLMTCGGIALAGGAWFTYLQIARIGQICNYCSSTHLCAAVASLLIWLHAPITRDPQPAAIRPRLAAIVAALAVAAVAALITIQTLQPAPSTRVRLLQDSVQLDPRRSPILGRPDAPVILVEIYDYTCPHCRLLYQFMHQARQRYGDQLAIIMLPTPLNSDCNRHVTKTKPEQKHACELAKLALAVWLADSDQFTAMHEWLFEHYEQMVFDSPFGSNVEAARSFAETLVSKDALERTLADPAVDAWISTNNDLYNALGGGQPKLLLHDLRIDGRPETAQELFDLLEKHTSLRPMR